MQTISSKDKVQRFILNWFFMMLVWIMFTSTFASQELVVGAVVTMFISMMSISTFTCCTLKILSPVRMFWMVYYLFHFIVALIKANLDVARRVINPALPINPGVVKFKTKLTTNYSKMVLANSITLTPGTLTVDVIGDTFYIHWIDVTTTDPEEAFTEIAESFEKILLKIF